MRAQMLGAALRGRASTARVEISNQSVEDLETSGTATASITFESDGGVSAVGGTQIIDSQWLVNSTTGSNYEIRVTPTSGTFSSGTTGSWLALSSDRTWAVNRASLGTKTCIATVEIGLVGTSTALDTATITISATVE